MSIPSEPAQPANADVCLATPKLPHADGSYICNIHAPDDKALWRMILATRKKPPVNDDPAQNDVPLCPLGTKLAPNITAETSGSSRSFKITVHESHGSFTMVYAPDASPPTLETEASDATMAKSGVAPPACPAAATRRAAHRG